jgi:hypothetical protein
MVFEKFIRYSGLAVGLKPSAMECEARLRGLERIISSKTIEQSEIKNQNSEIILYPLARARRQP